MSLLDKINLFVLGVWGGAFLRNQYWQWEKRRQIRLRDAFDAERGTG